MKKISLIILLFIFLGTMWIASGDGKYIIKKPSEIDCTCGCGQKAVKCGDYCSVAKELLKKYKDI